MSYRFFGTLVGDEVTLSNDDVFHLSRVLRIKANESFEVVVSDTLYTCQVASFAPFQLRTIAKETLLSEPEPKVTLIYALPKGDKLDFVVQKAVELGVDHILLVATKNAVTKFDESKSDRKLERFAKIIKSAAMQSKRNMVPTIEGVLSFKEMLQHDFDLKLIAHEKATMPVHKILAKSAKLASISILVGPEGGFSDDEVTRAERSGYQIISFGKAILRSETAVLYALSLIKHYKESHDENI